MESLRAFVLTNKRAVVKSYSSGTSIRLDVWLDDLQGSSFWNYTITTQPSSTWTSGCLLDIPTKPAIVLNVVGAPAAGVTDPRAVAFHPVTDVGKVLGSLNERVAWSG